MNQKIEAIRERPMLFSAPMVCAVLEDRKTQTRRVAKLTDNGYVKEPGGHRRWHPDDPNAKLACPYGQPGDRLWVRESLRFVQVGDNRHEHVVYASDGTRVRRDPALVDWACDGMSFGIVNSVPSIHLPRWASRITLEIAGVRVEHLQDISREDAVAEGIVQLGDGGYGLPQGEYYHSADPRMSFWSLWAAINGPASVEANPRVWVVEFKKMEAT